MEYYGDDYRSYLAHYGVLGMKWGIRRFQPYSTHPRKSGEGGKELGEAKKVAAYKEKEIRKAEKAYAKDIRRVDGIAASNQKWLDRKKRAYENTTDEGKRAKLKKKIEKGEKWAKAEEMRKVGIQTMRSAEISAIKKMNMADIKAEKKKIGKEIAKDIAFDIGTIPIAMLTGVYVYRTPNIRNIKTRSRLGLDDKKNKKNKTQQIH